MCLLTFLPDGVFPDLDALACGACANPDGHGFAVVDGDQLIVRRPTVGKVRCSSPRALAGPGRAGPGRAGPAMFHSRFANHGARDLANCHPFAVSGDQRTVLAHNGILPAIVRPGRRDRRSDTRIAAEELSVPDLRRHRFRLVLQRWMTDDNKMVLLTVNLRVRRQAYILNEQVGLWNGGCWCSNTDCQPEPAGPPPWFDGWDPADLNLLASRMVLCPECGAAFDAAEPLCPVCGRCAGWGNLPGFCTCYTPLRR
ncbi:hypothetical protein Aca07nite_84580 [Actinoplanes capillaceus]|uniref:Glutamine amidotransferase type-2 domain-containing protein n=1 Tax=Actinoplanes campanulatus TaxID=113559 RepID=A0ABQ3WYH0_9ACTN|nr:hypothetical protein [Actinoplanes capillaceus]GID51183.1 hypothetical protein Aca07nite_84580 [Actinoplanes capillaceus]